MSEQQAREAHVPTTPEEWAILDILRSHHFNAGAGTSRPGDPGWSACQCGVEMYWTGWQPHIATLVAAHVAAVVAEKDAEIAKWKEVLVVRERVLKRRETAALARLGAIAALVEECEGYGHGEFNIHLDATGADCSVCKFVARLRALLPTPTTESDQT